MPVTPEYTWSETLDKVSVRVVLTGAVVRKPNLVITSAFLRISSSPYLLHLDLFKDIEYEEAQAELTAGGIDFCLPKVGHTVEPPPALALLVSETFAFADCPWQHTQAVIAYSVKQSCGTSLSARKTRHLLPRDATSPYWR